MSRRRSIEPRRPDLAYALRLLASGQGIDSVWREAGYVSRKALADRIYRAAERIAAVEAETSGDLKALSLPPKHSRPGAVGATWASGPGREPGVVPKKVIAKIKGHARLRLTAYADGGSLGNPGPAGCGAVLVDESGEVLLEDHRYLGQTTNNVAEYEGAVLALSRARELGAREVELKVDSELLVNQIRGGYRVKSANLTGLYSQLKQLASEFDRFEITRIGRGENKRADKLANLAMASRGRE